MENQIEAVLETPENQLMEEQSLMSGPQLGDTINILYSPETGMVEAWTIGSESDYMVQVSYDPESILFTKTFYCQVIDGEIIYRQDLYEKDMASRALAQKKIEAQEYIDYATPLINRHRDELELGDPTTLTTTQYRELLRKRNESVTVLNSLV